MSPTDQGAKAEAHEWRTEKIKSGTSADELQEKLSQYNRSWKVIPGTGKSDLVTIGSRVIGNVLLTEMDMSEVHGIREGELLDPPSEAFFNLCHVTHGTVETHGRNHSGVQSPETIYVWISSEPVEFFVTERVTFLNIMVPVNQIERRLRRFNKSNVLLSSNTGPGKLFCGHLLGLASVAREKSHIDEQCVSEATLQLVANLLRCSVEIGVVSGSRERLLRELRDYVSNNIHRTDLSPKLVASEFGLSVRYIHKLFRETDESMMRFVRAERLEAARADLLDPYFKDLSITEISYKFAFSDSGNFSRIFKEKFGVSPKEYRQQGQDWNSGSGL